MDKAFDPGLIERLRTQGKLGLLNLPDGFDYVSYNDAADAIAGLLDALNYAHSEGFEWPVDPIPPALRTPNHSKGGGDG